VLYVRYCGPDCSLFRSMYPDRAGWGRSNMLLAEMVDSLHWLQWAKTKAGQKGRNRPRLVPRPGVGTQQRQGAKPKASPLSVIKKRFQRRDDDNSRGDKIKTLFGRR
jgi:hypothetical protein